jgi:hypothetical protein
MSFFPCLHKRMTGLSQTRRRPTRQPTRRFRPRLEALEGRDVPTTLNVTTALDDGSAGSLRAEIAAAQSGDNIVFDQGLNGKTITLTQGELQIARNLSIQGPGAGLLSISGGGAFGSRVFEIDGTATTVNLSGLSLIDGNGLHYPYTPGGGVGWGGGGQSGGTGTASDGQGGAIWNGGVLTVSGCTLASNSVDANPAYLISIFYGGAIYNAGTLTVSNSTLSNNAAGDYYWTSGGSRGNGGAIYNAGTLTVNSNSTVSFNTAYGSAYAAGYGTGIGGGIDNAGSLSVSGSILTNNSGFFGGAIFSGYKTSAAVTGTTLSHNSAADGGAIWNDGTMTLSGIDVDGNTATHAGGGVYNAQGGHLTIQSKSTVTGNSAPAGFGADLYTLGPTKISKDSTVGLTGP